MKKIILIASLLVLTGTLQSAFGQRYLDTVFSQVKSIRNVPYGQALNYKGQMEQLYFDFYEAIGDKSDKRPLVIYAHGGGFTGGTPKWPSIEMMCEKLAKRGYAIANISYRLDPRFNFMKCDTNKRAITDAMHDMRAAIRFFKAHGKEYKIDTSHIFITGESAGAVTAMMAGYVNKQEDLKSYPMTNPDNIEGNSGTPGYSSSITAVMCLCGLMYDTTAINADDAPLLWIHGSSDPLVPIAWASEIPERAEHVGLKYQKIVYDGATHCPWYYELSHWKSYLDSTVNYMSHFMYSMVTGKTPPAIQRAPPPLHVADIFQSNMVIQEGKPFKIWGSSTANDTIEVLADWRKEPLKIYAGQNGHWIGEIPVPKAVPGNFDPHTIRIIHQSDTINLNDILIGEVWICAGQSNMDMKVKKVTGWYRGVLRYEEEIAAAKYPAIRVFTEESAFNVEPQVNIRGKWQVCSPETAGNFSAVSYFFGRKLFQKLNVPIGLVVVAEAGASCEAFVPKNILTSDPVLKKKYWDPYKSFVASQAGVDTLGFFTKVTRPMLIYNGMIHPLEDLSVRGFIWYQGESNYSDKSDYTRLCAAMIKDWRKNFNQGNLPFYFVQIAPYAHNWTKNPIIMPLFWQAQQGLLKLKNTGMAYTVDVGDTANIHPRNKKPVGERLAKIALHKTYGYTDIIYKGPVYKKFKIENDIVKIFYDHEGVGSGLTTNDGQLPKYFYVAGADRVFHKAKARIIGNQVWVSSKDVPQPIAVRYAFMNDPMTNLQNKEGLPAVPFRTDDWKE